MSSTERSLKIFCDANVLFRGTTLPRFSYEVLVCAYSKKVELVLSPQVIEEARRNVARKLPGHLDRLESFLQTSYELVPNPSPEDVAAHGDLVRDASDIPIALAAAAAGVDYLITTDPDLTNEETAKRLQEQLGLRVLRVGEFLNKVMGYSHETLTGISQRRWVDLGEAPAWEESDESPVDPEPRRRL